MLMVCLLMSQSPAYGVSLGDETTALKAEAALHAKDVAGLEHKVRQLVDTRLTIYLNLASQGGLDLDSVELFVDGKPVASHLYSPRENSALQQGGIHQLFTGNLVNGAHEVKAVITARAANDRFVRRESSYRFRKSPGELRLEMALEARAPDYEPRVSLQPSVASLETGLALFAEAHAGWNPEVLASSPVKSKQHALYEKAESARLRGDAESAGQILATMDEGFWSAVGYLNLSADYARRDLKPARALVALRVALAMADKDSDAQRKAALRSRILLRAGYLAYTNSEFEKAIGFLEKVPLDSHKTPQALYFHGLSLAALGNHRAAMQSWHRAKKFPLAYPGVAEAWIGMGRGYDLSGYLGQAGEAYLAANAAYESERVTLRTLASHIEEQGAYKALVLDARSQGYGAGVPAGSGPAGSAVTSPKVEWFLADSRTLTQPRIAYLLSLMEQPSAQLAVDQVADLARMAAGFQRNAQDLQVFISAIEEELESSRGSSGDKPGHLQQLLADARSQREKSLKYLERAKALCARAEEKLNRIALDFVATQDQKMVFALDKTEQQIAHLYEYLALQGLEPGERGL